LWFFTSGTRQVWCRNEEISI